jgi:Lrp/AsnC family leucine-responsive transcriptional regulator
MHKTFNNKVLDDLNRHILEELQKDARLSTVEIGRRIGLSAPAVADRIQKLEDLGFIKGYCRTKKLSRIPHFLLHPPCNKVSLFHLAFIVQLKF